MNAPPNLVVVKVGGSLYDHPRLGEGLRTFLNELLPAKTLIVAGGGSFADAVRDLNGWQRLGDEFSHELAMRTLDLATSFLGHITFRGPYSLTVRLDWWESEYKFPVMLDSSAFVDDFNERFGPLPHTWEFTTDSIAALAAKVANARLILLKSTEIPSGTPWSEAVARGWIDAYFPTAVADAKFPIEAINFRKWLDERFPAESGG